MSHFLNNRRPQDADLLHIERLPCVKCSKTGDFRVVNMLPYCLTCGSLLEVTQADRDIVADRPKRRGIKRFNHIE